LPGTDESTPGTLSPFSLFLFQVYRIPGVTPASYSQRLSFPPLWFGRPSAELIPNGRCARRHELVQLLAGHFPRKIFFLSNFFPKLSRSTGAPPQKRNIHPFASSPGGVWSLPGSSASNVSAPPNWIWLNTCPFPYSPGRSTSSFFSERFFYCLVLTPWPPDRPHIFERLTSSSELALTFCSFFQISKTREYSSPSKPLPGSPNGRTFPSNFPINRPCCPPFHPR